MRKEHIRFSYTRKRVRPLHLVKKSIRTRDYWRLTRLLRELRQKAGLRQVDVAERLCEPQNFVSRYESGERRLDVIELTNVAHALGMTLEEVLELLWPDGPPTPSPSEPQSPPSSE